MNKGRFSSKHFGKKILQVTTAFTIFTMSALTQLEAQKAVLQIKWQLKALALLDRYAILLDAIHAHKTIL